MNKLPNKFSSNSRLLGICLMGALSICPVDIHAAPYTTSTWNGPTDGNFGTTTNWSTGVVPGQGTANVAGLFNTSGSGNLTVSFNATPAVPFAGLIFDGAAYNGSTGYTIAPGGGTLTLNSTASNSGIQLFNTFTGTGITETVAAPIVIGAAGQSFTNYTASSQNDTLAITGNITNTVPNTLNLLGTGNGTIGGAISNGTGTQSVLMNSSGTWTLGGANTYTGTTTVSGGGTLNLTGTLPGTTSPVSSSYAPIVFQGSAGTLNFNHSVVSGAGSTNTQAWYVTVNSGDATIANTVGTANKSTVNLFLDLSTIDTSGTMTQGSLLTTTRAAGATLNFVEDGTPGTNNNITIAQLNGNPSFLGPSVYFNGSNFAFYDASTGFVRGVNYDGSDADSNYYAYQFGSASSNTNFPTMAGLNGSVSYAEVLGDDNGEGNVQLAGLLMSGSSSIEQSAGTTITVQGILKSGGGGSTITGGTIAAEGESAGVGDGTLDIRTDAPSDTLEVDSDIVSPTNNVVKSGAGTLILTGDNTYTGGTILNGGVVQVQNLSANPSADALGSGTITFVGGTLQYSSSNTKDYSLRIVNSTGAISIDTNGQNITFVSPLAASNTDGLTKLGAGTLTLPVAEAYSGMTTIQNGTLVLAGTGSIPASSITFGGGTTSGILQLGDASGVNSPTFAGLSSAGTGTANQIFNGATSGSEVLTINGGGNFVGTIGGTGTNNNNISLVKMSSATQILTGTNTYTGGTTLAGGELQLGSAGALGTTGNIIFSGGTLGFSAGNTSDYSSRIVSNSSVISLDTNGQTVSMTNLGAGNTGGLTKLGLGTLTLFGTDTYTGLTTLALGNLDVGSADALDGGGNITFTGGALQYSAANTTDYDTRIVNSTGPVTFDTNGQNVTLAGILAASNSGGLQKNGAGTLTLTGTQLYTGPTIFAGGALNVGSVGAINSAGNLVFKGGTLQFSSANTTDYSSRIIGSTGAISIDTNSQNITFRTALASSNTGGLTKLGAGTLSLSAVNAYTGPTTISAGTLALIGASQLGGGTYAGAITDNATFVYGSSAAQAFSGILSGNGALIQSGSGTLTLTGANSYTGSITANNGTLKIGNGTIGSLNASSSLTLKGGTVNFNEAANIAQTFSTPLTVSSGDSTLQSTYGGSGTTTLTFASLSNPNTGGTVNFLTSGGTNGTNNFINFTTSPGSGFMATNLFFGGSDYAYYDTSGATPFVRGVNYGTDGNTVISPGGADLTTSATGSLPITSATNDELTGSVTAQGSVALNSLNDTGAFSVTQTGGTTMTVQGVLKDGGSATCTISGGTLTTGGGTPLVIRTNLATDALTISSAISSTTTGGLVKSGLGTLLLNSGANAYTGGTAVAGGTLEIANNASALGSNVTGNAITLAGNTTLEFTNGTTNQTYNHPITLTGAAALETDGTFNQAFTLNGNIDNGGNLFTIESANISGNVGTLTINGIISGSGGLTKTSVGSLGNANGLVLNLTQANTYSGPTTILAGNPDYGAVVITAANNLGDGSATNTITLGGTLQTSGTFDLGANRAITLVPNAPDINSTSGTLTISGSLDDSSQISWTVDGGGNVIISGAINQQASGVGQLVYNGTGVLTLTGNNTNWNKSASNSFGLLDINNGVVNATTASLNGTSTSGDIIFGQGGSNSAGTLQAGTGGISLARNVDLAKSGVGAAFDMHGQNNTISGVIQNQGGSSTGGLFTVKDTAGGGTLTLTRANTYTGGTSVTGGKLRVDGGVAGASSGTGLGAIAVSAGATLSGSGAIRPTAALAGIKLASGSTLASGDSVSGTIPSAGLTLDNSVAHGTILDASLGNVTLAFDLGSGTTGLHGGTAAGFANPNISSSYLKVVDDGGLDSVGELKFATGDIIQVNDLTGGNLAYSRNDPDLGYLLIQAGSNANYAGLVTSGGAVGGVAQNGWVENLTLSGTGADYGATRLYLYNGDLEVVPEPGTWALMIGGLALLVFLQRRKTT